MKCKETILYMDGGIGYCTRSEHADIFHDFVRETTPTSTPSSPASEFQIEDAENSLRDLFNT